MLHSLRWVGGALCGAAIFAMPATAHAQDDPGGLLAAVIMIPAGAIAGAGGIVTGIGTAATLPCDRPPRGWYISSFAMGGLNVIVGAAWFGLAGARASDDEADADFKERGIRFFSGLGAGHLALAGVNFTLAALAHVKHENAPPEQLMVVPVHDSEGRIALGGGLAGRF